MANKMEEKASITVKNHKTRIQNKRSDIGGSAAKET